MRRKRLKHYADIICKMFVGWRMGDDFELLASLPDGIIDINLIDSTATHGIIGKLDLHVAKEITAWLRLEMEKDNIDYSEIKNASLRVVVNTGHVSTNKKMIVCFDFDCQSKIETSSTTYEATLKELHKWHTRKPIASQEKRD